MQCEANFTWDLKSATTITLELYVYIVIWRMLSWPPNDLKVTCDLKSEFSDLGNLCSHAFLACKYFPEMINMIMIHWLVKSRAGIHWDRNWLRFGFKTYLNYQNFCKSSWNLQPYRTFYDRKCCYNSVESLPGCRIVNLPYHLSSLIW